MLLPSANHPAPALLILDCGTAAIGAAAAFTWPQSGAASFARIERPLARLAHRKGLTILTVGLSVLLLRLATLPLFTVPIPFDPDGFSYLQASDTFAHGRLANPTADIDDSKIVWAREMDAAENQELLKYYRNRTVS